MHYTWEIASPEETDQTRSADERVDDNSNAARLLIIRCSNHSDTVRHQMLVT